MSAPAINNPTLTYNKDIGIFKDASGAIYREDIAAPGTLKALDPANFPNLANMVFTANPRVSSKMEIIKAARAVLHNEGALTVDNALSNLGFSGTIETFLKSNYREFLSFGIKDSSKLRLVLHKLMDVEKLTADERFLVYFLFAQVKNANRVHMAIDNLNDAAKADKMMMNVRSFINKRITQYVKDETPEKFAAVHLPTTLPGLDIYCGVIMIPKINRRIENVISRQTFSQMNVSDDLLSQAYEYQKNFWETVVVKTNNAANTTFKAEFREDFWKTSASDKYLLIDDKFHPVFPIDIKIGYTEKEVVDWMASVRDLSA